jgi:uncharacterized protein (DUF1330 family)
MAKAYWICAYRSITDLESLAAYGKLAGPAIQQFGGQMIVRGVPTKVYGGGLPERVVIVQFDSIEQATAAHESPAYQQALSVLGNANERDFRVVEGLD